MTVVQAIQDALYVAASTVSLWRDVAIMALAVSVIVLVYLASSAE